MMTNRPSDAVPAGRAGGSGDAPASPFLTVDEVAALLRLTGNRQYDLTERTVTSAVIVIGTAGTATGPYPTSANDVPEDGPS
jgi:hypothetical protein